MPIYFDNLFSKLHDDVMKWKHFPRYWPFVRGIHRSPVNFPHKGQWRGALMFSLICVGLSGWVYNREAGYLRRHRAHYDVIVMTTSRHKLIKMSSINHLHMSVIKFTSILSIGLFVRVKNYIMNFKNIQRQCITLWSSLYIFHGSINLMELYTHIFAGNGHIS